MFFLLASCRLLLRHRVTRTGIGMGMIGVIPMLMAVVMMARDGRTLSQDKISSASVVGQLHAMGAAFLNVWSTRTPLLHQPVALSAGGVSMWLVQPDSCHCVGIRSLAVAALCTRDVDSVDCRVLWANSLLPILHTLT